MRISLPLKLGIFVIVIFGLLFVGMALWRPMKVRYYISRLGSDNEKIRADAVKKLLASNETESLFRHYTERYESKDVEERMAIVDELCNAGDRGKELMREIFLGRCIKEQVRIPAGTLTLENGSKVKIKSLRVDKYEVANEKYYVYAICTGLPVLEAQPSGGIVITIEEDPDSDYPAVNFSWHDAKTYADWLGMRLPTQYEWEYAARAGSTGNYCFGDNVSLLGEYAWYKENSDGLSHPVGQKRPNRWGLYDAYGNVSEWCLDKFGKDKHYYVGGNYSNFAFYCSFYGRYISGVPLPWLGFRCVRDAK